MIHFVAVEPAAGVTGSVAGKKEAIEEIAGMKDFESSGDQM